LNLKGLNLDLKRKKEKKKKKKETQPNLTRGPTPL
jgi:hypothetical protein